MVVAEIIAAVAPYAPLLALTVILAVAYFEGRGALQRWGTTSRRSGTGAVASVLVIGVAGVGLVLTGWPFYGGLVLAIVLLLFVGLALGAANRRWR